ncbi:aarF domain-containing kinase [Cryptococcus neoformans]|nr:aarF domain-containing kinase [Cryptococcus neoformans var. grubii Ze90-1]OXH41563.1 aarF domain-containing kinase [Cryptococcus neoformans var. grubii]
MIPIRHKSCSLASLAGRTLPRATCRAPQQYRFSSPPATPPADQEEHQIKPLTGSAKLFADAGAEEKVTSNASNRDHLRMTQGPVWTGDESTTDAVLRMLVDAHKPLRDKGGVKHNAADEKIKGWMKRLQLEPRLSPGPSSPPEEAQEIALESVEKENPHRTKIPPHLHRPWHATYTGESRTAEAPKVKYGAFINKRTDGDSLTNLLELQLPPNADGKTRAKVKAARKSSMLVGRMDKAREGALDYKLGLGVDDTYMVETGEEGQTFKGNRQIKGSSVLGAQRGSASGMKAWAGLVEDRILRAREAGFFKNASGKGKPIVADPEARNPHIERGELFMNRIIKRQGALPPWIELQNLLDSNLRSFRATLLTTYKTQLVRNVISTNALHPLPPLHTIPDRDEAWEAREFKFHQENVKQINDLVRRMNAQAPSPARRHLITLEGELNKIRGNVLKNEVWEEIKRRAEESINMPYQQERPGLAPFIFDGENWTKLKNATKRSFGTVAVSDTAPLANANLHGLEGSSKGYSGGPGGDHSSGPSSYSGRDPRPLRLMVMAGVSVGVIIYLRHRPVKNDSAHLDSFRHHLQPTPPPQSDIVASSPSEPPLTFIRIIEIYILEPIGTFFRFLHLACLFVPVILSSPMLLVGKPGKRHRSRSGRPINEEEQTWGAIWWYGFLVKQMERAGPSFIKLGQWAASRADLFPAELCEKMSKLHSNGRPHSLGYTKKVMEAAFNMGFDDIFEEFGEEPIGCGAIAQVYKAKLQSKILTDTKLDGLPRSTESDTASVAIKVIHPRVRKTIRRDIAIMSIFANFINAFPGMQWFSLPEEVQVFGEMMNSQLDLRVEASNLDKFLHNFEKRGRRVTFPTPIKVGDGKKELEEEMKDVLLEEFEDALPLKYFLQNGGGPYDHKIANIGLDAFLEMLLIDNWTHGDLHPGNIMVRFYKPTTTDYLSPLLHAFGKNPTPSADAPVASHDDLVHILTAVSKDREKWLNKLDELHQEGYEPQLIFIDAGLVTSLDSKNRRNFLDLFQAVAEFDGYKAGKLMIERCRTPDFAIDEETFALKMQHIVLSVKSKTFSLAKIKISDILTDVLKAVRQHHVKMEGDFVNTVISILLLEGIGRQLDPDMDLFKSALPILRQLGKQMGTREAIQATPTGNILAMIKLWVWVEARQVAGEVSTLDEWMKYDRLTPSI